jgi:hypothetical protein
MAEQTPFDEFKVLLRAEIRRDGCVVSHLYTLPQLAVGLMLYEATQTWHSVDSAMSTVYSEGRNKQSEACLTFSPTLLSLYTTFLL